MGCIWVHCHARDMQSERRDKIYFGAFLEVRSVRYLVFSKWDLRFQIWRLGFRHVAEAWLVHIVERNLKMVWSGLKPAKAALGFPATGGGAVRL